MRYFKMQNDGKYVLKKFIGIQQCQDCLDPWCPMKRDKGKAIVKICDKVKDDYPTECNKKKRFRCYKNIAYHIYGELLKGARCKLGICCELYVCKQFPSEDGEAYGEFVPANI